MLKYNYELIFIYYFNAVTRQDIEELPLSMFRACSSPYAPLMFSTFTSSVSLRRIPDLSRLWRSDYESGRQRLFTGNF